MQWWMLSLAMGGCALGGCGFNYDAGGRFAPISDGGEWGEGRPTPPAECRPAERDWEIARYLYDTTEESVHEHITCGGMQVSLAMGPG